MQYKSVNPVNATLLKTFNSISDSELSKKLIKGHEAFLTWEKSSLDYRSNLIAYIADLLRKDVEMHAKFITLEMGKPIVQARAEIEKCILQSEYFTQK